MIQFVLDHRIHSVHDAEPKTSLLQYLRLVLVRLGTKEGCAAGDCGACTVVLGELLHGEMVYRTVNACITPLGSLHGKQVLTVESLGTAPHALHPVQEAMVECHGSQCGFCTPGFVMSLYAWWLAVKAGQLTPSRHTLELALSGNLCRCTGYQPILRAAEYSLTLPEKPGQIDQSDSIIALIRQIQTADGGDLRQAVGGFFAPTTSAELLALLAHYPDAHLVAGATDLALQFTQQLQNPATLIFTGAVSAMRCCHETEQTVTIGAAVTYSAMQPLLKRLFPEFAQLLDRLGSVQIRNQGTLAGNIANGSPVADTAPVLLALNAALNLIGPKGSRLLPLNEFFLSYRNTALAPGEAIESIVIPKLRQHEHLKVFKVSKRFDDDIAAVTMALCLRFDGTIHGRSRLLEARIACGGMAAIPARAPHTEQLLSNQIFDTTAVQSAQTALQKDFAPIDDVRASAAYRSAVAGNLILRCHQDLMASAPPPPWTSRAAVQPITHPSDARQSQSPLFTDVGLSASRGYPDA